MPCRLADLSLGGAFVTGLTEPPPDGVELSIEIAELGGLTLEIVASDEAGCHAKFLPEGVAPPSVETYLASIAQAA